MLHGRVADGDPIPERVKKVAELIGSDPLAWREKEDGSIVIVFSTKGKHTFPPEPAPEFKPIIHTRQEAAEVVKTLPPKSKKKER